MTALWKTKSGCVIAFSGKRTVHVHRERRLEELDSRYFWVIETASSVLEQAPVALGGRSSASQRYVDLLTARLANI